jgi:hypothetical protein
MGTIKTQTDRVYKPKAEDIKKLKQYLKRSNKNTTDGYTRWEKN